VAPVHDSLLTVMSPHRSLSQIRTVTRHLQDWIVECRLRGCFAVCGSVSSV